MKFHEDYEKYAGLRFRTRQVHRHTYEYKSLPLPEQTVQEFEESFLSKQKVCIDVYKGALPEKDYEALIIALLDENGNDLFRQDADKNEINNLFNSDPNDQFIHIWREYEDNKKPHSWRVWPYSASKQWCDRLEEVIKYE